MSIDIKRGKRKFLVVSASMFAIGSLVNVILASASSTEILIMLSSPESVHARSVVYIPYCVICFLTALSFVAWSKSYIISAVGRVVWIASFCIGCLAYATSLPWYFASQLALKGGANSWLDNMAPSLIGDAPCMLGVSIAPPILFLTDDDGSCKTFPRSDQLPALRDSWNGLRRLTTL